MRYREKRNIAQRSIWSSARSARRFFSVFAPYPTWEPVHRLYAPQHSAHLVISAFSTSAQFLPNYLMYTGVKHVSRGRPTLRFKEVCKRDLKAYDINPTIWQVIAAESNDWRQAWGGARRRWATSEKTRESTGDRGLHRHHNSWQPPSPAETVAKTALQLHCQPCRTDHCLPPQTDGSYRQYVGQTKANFR